MDYTSHENEEAYEANVTVITIKTTAMVVAVVFLIIRSQHSPSRSDENN